MVDPRGNRYLGCMTTTTSIPSLRKKALVAGVILAGFTTYSLWVVAGYGYTGFLSLASREPWALQLLLDLVIACSFGIGWMVHDARKYRIATWPFVIATLAVGSIGLLGYVAWRGFAPRAELTPRPGT
jgi:hypothetical protein